MKYFIKTFGCQQNVADSERLTAILQNRGMKPARSIKSAGYVVINTCMIRESAENRVYGLLNNLTQRHPGTPPTGGVIGSHKDAIASLQHDELPYIVLTGCLVGMATKDSTGKFMKRLRDKFPMVNEFLPMEEVGFETAPLRTDKDHAWVPISNGCNNFCTYCVVPFTRGREVSRPYADIVNECKSLKVEGFKAVTLLGQNVNSYGADLKSKLKPVMVKSMGRKRIPTLFPSLLADIAKLGFEKVGFISSNPWDFSSELIEVIAKNKNISREIHLPVQSGDNEVLHRMNRWYTRDEYLELVANLKFKIRNLKLTTDIIVGFPGETEKQFKNTVDLCKKVGFSRAYISEYSDRPLTAAHKIYKDDVLHKEKKRRWLVLDNLINKSCHCEG